jgi:uroporphyrinogen III methyltransferase/synthase
MKVLITRPRKQAEPFATTLKENGFEPVFFPVIAIQPFEENVALDRAIANLDCYDWLVFTSVNGVEAFFDRYNSPLPDNIKTAAIGPKTAHSLKTRGVTLDFVPNEYVAEAILPGLGDLRGRWVLLPRAEIARKALPEAILEAGGVAHVIAVYQTFPVKPDADGLAVLKSGVDAVTFTSPSTVSSFVEIVRDAGLNPYSLPGKPKIACIGPITQMAAEEAGFVDMVVADEYTVEGLVDALRNILENKYDL